MLPCAHDFSYGTNVRYFERSFKYGISSILYLHLATGKGHWNEPVQCFTEQWGIYVANLMHQDSRSVIKVVRYGLNILCLPNEHAVELGEQQIAKQENTVKRLDTLLER